MAVEAAAKLEWPRGFRWAALGCGLRRRPLDLALMECPATASGAALFTTNRLQAAPVRLSRAALERSGGRVRALLVNSGNANCATGAAGRQAAQASAQALAKRLGCATEEILVCSTGVIGVPLAYRKIVAALPELLARNDDAALAAQAILTTDTRAKMASAAFRDRGRTFRVAGMAKGSGMIHPRMATMLGFLFTDAAQSPGRLRRALRTAVDRSFHRITVDGDTSTNDTVALLASGAGGRLSASGQRRFEAALLEVAQSLARQIVLDGEGARHFVTIEVEGARAAADADRIARAIAHSPLVKTALAGSDANWGRVLCAAGYAGPKFDPERTEIWIGGMAVYRRGRALPFDEEEAKWRLDAAEVTVRLHLHAGRARAWIWTCDLTDEYIRINGAYRT